MRDGGAGGAILFTASTAATHICDLLGAYAASKAGVRMLAKSLASELGVWRIRVNLVLPGVVETAMKSVVRQVGSEIGRQLVRGVLGSLMGGGRKR
jgi:NAD(P)-dependent dehydrogenase (short-subunit alcohol dehydrogenase family)